MTVYLYGFEPALLDQLYQAKKESLKALSYLSSLLDDFRLFLFLDSAQYHSSI